MPGLPLAAGRLPAPASRSAISKRYRRDASFLRSNRLQLSPEGFPKCDAADSASHHEDQDCNYVSEKVIVAKVFYNKAHKQGLDAQAIQDHGTHTAGIAAGVTGKTAVVNGVEIDDMSGIAPGAWLGNYNVFPGGVVRTLAVKTS